MLDNQADDDLSISGDTKLYRRVDPRFIKRDGDTVRISAGAFQNTSATNEMSVSLGDTLALQRREPGSLLLAFPGYGLVAITAELARLEDQSIRRSETPEDPAHGDVVGDKPPGRRKRFAGQCTWAVTPA